MIASIVFDQMVMLFLLMMAGYIAAKCNMLDGNSSKHLSAILTKIMVPAMTINSFQAPFSWEGAQGVGLALLSMFLITCIGLVLPLILVLFKRMEKSEMGIWMCCCAFTNFIFFGKPVIEAVYGKEALFQLFSMSLGYSLLMFSLGIALVNMGKHQGGSPVKNFLRAVINPATIAGVLGLLFYFFSIRLPVIITDTFDMLSAALTPVSMLIIGHSLKGTNIKALLLDWKVYAISFIRLILAPLVAHALLSLFISDPVTIGVATVVAAMPVAATSGILAEQYESPHRGLANKSIVVSTLLSMGTIPLIAALLL